MIAQVLEFIKGVVIVNIVDLLEEDGFHPRRVASTHGGEFHGPCPVDMTDNNKSELQQLKILRILSKCIE